MAEENGNGINGFAQKLLGILAVKVDDVDAALKAADPALSRDQLTFLRIAEEGDKNRKGVLVAIDAAFARIDKAEADAVEAAARKAAQEAEAKLLRFGHGIPLAEGADAAAAALSGPSFLVLGDGAKEIAGLSRVGAKPEQFTRVGDRVMYGRPIKVAGADVKVLLRDVALADEDGNVHALCEIPNGIPLGGHTVELPAGSLIFG